MTTIKEFAKKNRMILVIMGIVVIILMSNGSSTNQATVAECNQHNTGNFMITDNQAIACKATLCNVQYNWDPTSWRTRGIKFITGLITGGATWLADAVGINSDFATCTVKVENNKWVLAGSQSAANSQCISDYSVIVNENFIGNDGYKCFPKPAELECQSGFLGELGKFVQKAGIPIADCSTAGIAGIGIGILFGVIAISFI